MGIGASQTEEGLVVQGKGGIAGNAVVDTDMDTAGITNLDAQNDALTGSKQAMSIYYESGIVTDRKATLVDDPVLGSPTKALELWLNNATTPNLPYGPKGRVQVRYPYGRSLNLEGAFCRFSMYLDPNHSAYLASTAANQWYNFMTLWVGADWEGDTYPFVISLDIAKGAGSGSPLYFIVEGISITAGVWTQEWAVIPATGVPLGTWLDFEFNFKTGGAGAGNFYWGAKVSGPGDYSTLVNVHDWTYHPDSPVAVGLKYWDIAKLYTNDLTLAVFDDAGEVPKILYKDIQVWEGARDV